MQDQKFSFISSTNQKLANFHLNTNAVDGYMNLLYLGLIAAVIVLIISTSPIGSVVMATIGITSLICFIIAILCLSGFAGTMDAKQIEFQDLFEEEIAEFETKKKLRLSEMAKKESAELFG